jgi:hypothetical protein
MTSDKIFELHSFYSRLLESYAMLSEDEISASLLDEEFKHKAISWESFGRHISYLANKLEISTLDAERKELVANSLERQQANYEEYEWQPEARMIIGEGDRHALIARRLQLLGGYYYIHEKERWQQSQAEGRVTNWEEIPQGLINEIDKKIHVLDEKRNGTWPALPVIGRQLTPAQEEAAFYLRWDEFRNVVNISFSSPDDDDQIIVYSPANPPLEAGGAGLWCPMSLDGQTHEPWRWLGFRQQKRDAIRMGFMLGICNIINISAGNLADWRARRAEFSPHLYERYFNPITEQTRRTKQYAQGRLRIEKLLKIIYSSGREIAYHPDFDQAFLNHLERLPLYEVNGFLTGFCEREGMGNPSGYTHLLELVTNAVQTSVLSSRDAINRTTSWLRAAVQSPDASPTELYKAAEATAPPHSSKTTRRSRVQYTVADLYASPDAKRREEIAAKVKLVWDKLRLTLRSPADAPTTVAALFQLIDWLGMVRDGISAAEWRDAFQREWQVEISEGIGKYQLKNPKSDKFQNAVRSAFDVIKDSYPMWVKGKDLPSIYR